jgi:hypothetical protein
MHVESLPMKRAAANLAITAGAGQDGQAQTGIIIDRGDSDVKYSRFVTIAIPYSAVLAEGKLLTLKTVKIEHSVNSNLSSPADYKVFENSTGTAIATGATGGSTEAGVKMYSVDLGAARRYIRLSYTPDLDATATDTAALSALAVFDAPYQRP